MDDQFPVAEDRCTHEHQELRRRAYNDRSTAFVYQCLRCGSHVRALSKDDLVVRNLATHPPEFETGLAERYWQERFERRRALWESRKVERQESYRVYLLTTTWREKRQQRPRFDRGRCRAQLNGCTDVATEVHHLTYAHLGNEPLFDLVSVCDSCHAQITEMDRPAQEASHAAD